MMAGSSPGTASTGMKGHPIYQIYGETCALTVKTIMPDFRIFGSTIVMEARRRGRMLFEWAPRNAEGVWMCVPYKIICKLGGLLVIQPSYELVNY